MTHQTSAEIARASPIVFALMNSVAGAWSMRYFPFMKPTLVITVPYFLQK